MTQHNNIQYNNMQFSVIVLSVVAPLKLVMMLCLSLSWKLWKLIICFLEIHENVAFNSLFMDSPHSDPALHGNIRLG
jgi:hypothetical protein